MLAAPVLVVMMRWTAAVTRLNAARRHATRVPACQAKRVTVVALVRWGLGGHRALVACVGQKLMLVVTQAWRVRSHGKRRKVNVRP